MCIFIYIVVRFVNSALFFALNVPLSNMLTIDLQQNRVLVEIFHALDFMRNETRLLVTRNKLRWLVTSESDRNRNVTGPDSKQILIWILI